MIHGDVILNKKSTCLKPERSDYENPRITIGLAGTRIVKFGEAEDAGIEEFIDVEFWLYRENTNENGFIISLNNATHLMIF